MQINPIHMTEETEAFAIATGEHFVGKFIGNEGGPSLVVFGSIHGNEQSGVLAMRRMLSNLESIAPHLKGRVYLIAGNTRALQENVRFIDSDLNRYWTDENVKRNNPNAHISTNRVEDNEQREILEILNQIISTAKDEVYALDLHSTSAESAPFAMIGDTFRNRQFAQKFPATLLLGIEEQLDSTILEYVNNLGAVTLGFEAGQHKTKRAVDNHEALVWLALLNSGILEEKLKFREKYEQVLKAAMGKPRIIEIRHRHEIKASDEFRMVLGFENFQPVTKNEILASDIHGEIKAVESGLILMPLYQKLGDDGFFIGRQILPFWLWLSRILRELKIGNLMHVLPGVSRHPTDSDTFIVNTGVARVFPLQIFHLLGFRKRRWRNDKLVVSRRRHDTKSPFKKK